MNKRFSFPDEKTALVRLRARIPEMQCVEGCSACCGPIPFSRAEWAAVPDKTKGQSKCGDCPFVADKERGGCGIHSDRPILCRLFGTIDTPQMRCPKGARPDKFLTDKQGEEITEEYITIIKANRHTYGPFRELFRKIRRTAGFGQ